MRTTKFVLGGAGGWAILAGLTVPGAWATAGPSTEPVVQAIAPQLKSDPRVEVFPFAPVGGVAAGDWTGRGIQENLQSDVSRTGATLVLPPQSPAPTQDSLTVARQNNADLAVVGTYQVVGNQIRANGHLIDVANDKTLGGFSATGAQQDLFKIEDALGEQLRSLLPGQMTPTQIREAFEQPEPTQIYQEPVATQTPVYTEQPATVNNYYDATPPTPNYYYPYNGDYYDNSYPYGFGFYGGFGYIYNGRGYGYHDHGYDGHNGGHYFGNAPAFRGNVGGGLHSGGFNSGGLHAAGVGGLGAARGGGFGGGGHR